MSNADNPPCCRPSDEENGTPCNPFHRNPALTPSTDALALIRNSIDRTLQAAEEALEHDTVDHPDELLKALRTLEFLGKSLTGNDEDQQRLARLAASIERLSGLPKAE